MERVIFYVILLFLIISILITKCSDSYIFKFTSEKQGLKFSKMKLIVG
jgi:hypothetical protein